MASTAHLQWLYYWHLAMVEPLGIYITTPNTVQLKGLLYSARAKAKDPRIAHMQVRTSPANPSGELWVINPPKPEA